MVDYKKLFFILLKEFAKQNNKNTQIFNCLREEVFSILQTSGATPEEIRSFINAITD